jgi:hypothetical protein
VASSIDPQQAIEAICVCQISAGPSPHDGRGVAIFTQPSDRDFHSRPARQRSWSFMSPRLATFRRKIDVFGSTVNGFGRAKTAGLPAVIFEGLW